MSYPVSLPFTASRAKHKVHKFRGMARSTIRHVSVPKSLKKMAEMPMTLAGIGLIASAVTILTLTGGLMFIGVTLIGLEYLVTD